MSELSRRRKIAKKAYDSWKNFSPYGDKCPLCKANFRRGCNHSIEDADRELHERYIRAVSSS